MSSKSNSDTLRDRLHHAVGRLVHPESGVSLTEGGYIAGLECGDGKIRIVLQFRGGRDPFASSLVRKVREAAAAAAPQCEIEVEIAAAQQQQQQQQQQAPTPEGDKFIKNIIAVASGKGGVGKSTVTANLAVTLAAAGFRTGVLDADIYGPSQPRMFGCEGYAPEVEVENGVEYMVPAEAWGVKVMSIGFFVGPKDALLWRGPMATSALRQLIHQTRWGELDYLLIDLPPGTGDVHLSIITELKIDAAVIVSTPQQVAVADVARGVAMFRNPSVNVPVLGVVENMSWFTPAELPGSRYYIFGRGGAARYAAENGLELLGQIPLIQAVAECADNGCPIASSDEEVAKHYRAAAEAIVEKCVKNG